MSNETQDQDVPEIAFTVTYGSSAPRARKDDSAAYRAGKDFALLLRELRSLFSVRGALACGALYYGLTLAWEGVETYRAMMAA